MSSVPNPFQYWYDECNSGTSASKLKSLPEMPSHIDVELTSVCNFRCQMCPTGNLSLERPGTFMEWETFERIVDQCEPHGIGIRFIGWGEPMMHPQFFRFLRYATDALLPTHLNTNGSKIGGEFEQTSLLGLGLDSIKFSFQGTSRESYTEMRNVDFFEQLFNIIRTFHRRRADRRRPFVSVSTSVTDEHPSTIEVFKKRFAPYCDQLSVGSTTFDFMDLDAAHHSDRVKALARAQTLEKRHFDPCPEVFDKVAIHANGSGHVCCNDYNGETDLGNIHHDTLEEMWNSDTMTYYREYLAEGKYNLPNCTNCFNYLGTKL